MRDKFRANRRPVAGARLLERSRAQHAAHQLALVAIALMVSQHWLGSPAGHCIVVDGDKKDELSALRNQARDEQLAIDQFNTKTCGMADPNYNEHEFINMAREGQFPWMVSFQVKILDDLSYKKQLAESRRSLNETRQRLQKQQAQTGGPPVRREDLHFCAGSLISDRWILSAAHCFSDQAVRNYLQNGKLIAVAGSNRVSSRNRLNRNLTIERVYVHSKFQAQTPVGHDIALVELRNESRLAFEQRRERDDFGDQQAAFFNSICLPKQDTRYQVNESARIAGWGLSQAREVRTMPSKLLATDLLLAPQEACLGEYKRALNWTEASERHDDLLCAGYKTTRDACQSDSGGPLMQYASKKAVVIGIVSYGIGCATRGVPGLYTRVSAHVDWIRAITMQGGAARANFTVIESRQVGRDLEAPPRERSTQKPAKKHKRHRRRRHRKAKAKAKARAQEKEQEEGEKRMHEEGRARET